MPELEMPSCKFLLVVSSCCLKSVEIKNSSQCSLTFVISNKNGCRHHPSPYRLVWRFVKNIACLSSLY
jgi:hypothetical protein